MSMRRALFSTKGKLPHTELSYLMGSGTQWIDTGIIGQSGLKTEISVTFIDSTQSTLIFGSRTSNGLNAFDLAQLSLNGRNDYATYSQIFTISINTQYIFTKNDNLFYINNILTNTDVKTTFTSNVNMYLFCGNNNGNPSTRAKLKVHYSKIWNNELLTSLS